MKKFWSILLIALFIFSEAVNISFAYKMERPSQYRRIEQRTENAIADDEAAVGIGVHIKDYFDGVGMDPFCGHDGEVLRVIATANTRKGIEYDYFTVASFAYWFEATEPTNIAGDDSGAWIDIPFGVTFYGGPGFHNTSGVYSRVWVCSNGFLSFDSSSNSSVPTNIPYFMQPNTLIAPFWSDLDPTGGSITYYADITKFVVEWKDVLCKYNGLRQTFEVVILNDYYPNFRGQNRIFLLYDTMNLLEQGSRSEISPLSIPPDPTICLSVGIEDQEGYRGTEPPYSGNIENGIGFQFTAKPFSSPEIRELNILTNKTDSYTKVYVDRNPWSVRGHNVQYSIPGPNPDEPDPPYMMRAVGGTVTLLMTAAIGHIYGAVAGFMWGATRVIAELGYDYAKQLAQADPVDIRDEYTNPGTDFCYVNASAATYHPPYDYPVDASVGSQFFWVFLDDNNLDHELTLTAQLKYYSNIQEEIITLETSTTLRVYIGTPSTPRRPEGCTSGYVDSYYTYNTSTKTPDGDSIYYQFDWNDGSSDIIGPYPSDINVSASHAWDSEGTYNVTVRAKDSSYELWSDWSSILTMSISSSPGGGGGGGPGEFHVLSPRLFIWNGSDYVEEVVFDIHGESDVTVCHTIKQLLVSEDDLYSLSLRELNESLSHIDYVKLYAVDTEGMMYENHLIHAIHSELGNVKQLLKFDDGNRVNLGPSQTIDLRFNVSDVENMIYFIFEIQGYEPN